MDKKRPRIKTTQKVTLKRTILIASSVAISLNIVAYTPVQKPWGDHQFLMSTYMRPTYQERKRASEMRRMQILAEIRKIRKQIRLQAETYVSTDQNTLIIAYTARQKTNIHCAKLVDEISRVTALKNKKAYENNLGSQWKVAVDFDSLG